MTSVTVTSSHTLLSRLAYIDIETPTIQQDIMYNTRLFPATHHHPDSDTTGAMSTSKKPLVLHAHASGPNPIKIVMALEFLQVPYTIKMWEFGDDPKVGVKGAAFTAINENGRVPALEDPNTGVVSWESGACMNYVRRVYDKQNVLGPRGDTEQDIVDLEKWEYFLLTTLGPMTGQCNWFRYVCPMRSVEASV